MTYYPYTSHGMYGSFVQVTEDQPDTFLIRCDHENCDPFFEKGRRMAHLRAEVHAEMHQNLGHDE